MGVFTEFFLWAIPDDFSATSQRPIFTKFGQSTWMEVCLNGFSKYQVVSAVLVNFCVQRRLRFRNCCWASNLPNLRIVPIPHTFRWPPCTACARVYIAQCFIMLFHLLVECLKGCLLLMWCFCNVWRGAANPPPKLAKLFAWNFEPMNNTFTRKR